MLFTWGFRPASPSHVHVAFVSVGRSFEGRLASPFPNSLLQPVSTGFRPVPITVGSKIEKRLLSPRKRPQGSIPEEARASWRAAPASGPA